MTSNIELNEIGTKASKFWENSLSRRVGGSRQTSIDDKIIINEYLSSMGLTANVDITTNPNTKKHAFQVYSGMDADFDFEGYVDWLPSEGASMLFNVMNKLGIQCYK